MCQLGWRAMVCPSSLKRMTEMAFSSGVMASSAA